MHFYTSLNRPARPKKYSIFQFKIMFYGVLILFNITLTVAYVRHSAEGRRIGNPEEELRLRIRFFAASGAASGHVWPSLRTVRPAIRGRGNRRPGLFLPERPFSSSLPSPSDSFSADFIQCSVESCGKSWYDSSSGMISAIKIQYIYPVKYERSKDVWDSFKLR